jgi:hypothetical protein
VLLLVLARGRVLLLVLAERVLVQEEEEGEGEEGLLAVLAVLRPHRLG